MGLKLTQPESLESQIQQLDDCQDIKSYMTFRRKMIRRFKQIMRWCIDLITFGKLLTPKCVVCHASIEASLNSGVSVGWAEDMYGRKVYLCEHCFNNTNPLL